jgi:hypothetical protein
MGFVRKNTYYSTIVYEWNLPTGWTCPQARECLVKVDRETGKQENSSVAYRCYAAAAERFPSARGSRWGNLESFQDLHALPELPRAATAVRIHASGDFFSQGYFDAWLEFIRERPSVDFWAFTKSLPYWVERLGQIPENLAMTASVGGRQDHLIEEHGLRYALVVPTPQDAHDLGLLIDTNDDLARVRGDSFALVDNYYKAPR